MSKSIKSTFQRHKTVEEKIAAEQQVAEKPLRKSTRRTIFAVILILIAMIAILFFLNISQYLTNKSNLEDFRSVYTAAIEERDQKLDEQYALVKELRAAASDNRGGDVWINDNVGFIPDDGERLYHRSTCPVWQTWGGPYWVFNVQYAEYMYYDPHSCWEEE